MASFAPRSASVAQPAPDERDAPPADGAAATHRAVDRPPPETIGYGAMPGGLHVASAAAVPIGSLEISALSGAGYRKGLLGPGHTLQRAGGGLAIAYAPASRVAVSLALDGRYDQHAGLAGMTGDGYAGDLHARARYVGQRGQLALGGELGIWLPGDSGPPSFALAATSVEARGLLALDLGTATLSLDAGFRLDRSAALVDRDDPPSLEHRVSLGASDFDAVVAGAQLRAPSLVSTAVLALDAPTQICQVALDCVRSPATLRTRQYTQPGGSAAAGLALR